MEFEVVEVKLLRGKEGAAGQNNSIVDYWDDKPVNRSEFCDTLSLRLEATHPNWKNKFTIHAVIPCDTTSAIAGTRESIPSIGDKFTFEQIKEPTTVEWEDGFVRSEHEGRK